MQFQERRRRVSVRQAVQMAVLALALGVLAATAIVGLVSVGVVGEGWGWAAAFAACAAGTFILGRRWQWITPVTLVVAAAIAVWPVQLTGTLRLSAALAVLAIAVPQVWMLALRFGWVGRLILGAGWVAAAASIATLLSRTGASRVQLVLIAAAAATYWLVRGGRETYVATVVRLLFHGPGLLRHTGLRPRRWRIVVADPTRTIESALTVLTNRRGNALVLTEVSVYQIQGGARATPRSRARWDGYLKQCRWRKIYPYAAVTVRVQRVDVTRLPRGTMLLWSLDSFPGPSRGLERVGHVINVLPPVLPI
jgi:hypothetical protein